MILSSLIIFLQSSSDILSTPLIEKLGEWSTVIVIITYLIYQLIVDSRRNKREELKNSSYLKFQSAIYSQLEVNDSINRQLLECLKTLKQRYVDEVSESQMRLIVEKVLEASKYATKSYILTIMRENHIKGNEDDIRSKIKEYCYNRHETDILILREYKYKNETLDTAILDKWPEEIFKITSGIVLSNKSEKTLSSSLSNKYEQYKNKMLYSILNRQEYI